MILGLYHAELPLADKGFYGIAFIMSMFAAVTVQKNTRDLVQYKKMSSPGDMV
ncbi:MAG: YiaA/YiaB family inner membrane protein [Mariniblastus sp.]